VPEVRDIYSDIEAMSPAELQMERDSIVRSAAGNFDALGVDNLRRLSAIYQVLRRKSVGPPKKAKAKSTTPKKVTLDDIFA
jgi:hypothetical protein